MEVEPKDRYCNTGVVESAVIAMVHYASVLTTMVLTISRRNIVTHFHLFQTYYPPLAKLKFTLP